MADLGDDLFEVSTGDDARVAPSVRVDGGTVLAGLRDTGRTGPAVVSVVLSNDVRWLVRLGGGAPVRVAATGGAGSVTVDGQTHTGVAGGTVWTPASWAAAPDRYDVDATAGVSRLSVERF